VRLDSPSGLGSSHLFPKTFTGKSHYIIFYDLITFLMGYNWFNNLFLWDVVNYKCKGYQYLLGNSWSKVEYLSEQASILNLSPYLQEVTITMVGVGFIWLLGFRYSKLQYEYDLKIMSDGKLNYGMVSILHMVRLDKPDKD
jgi:hypothetical protein